MVFHSNFMSNISLCHISYVQYSMAKLSCLVVCAIQLTMSIFKHLRYETDFYFYPLID